MKINEVMKATGLTKKAIYYYENEGLIHPMKIPGNNYRIYTEKDVRRLIRINILRRLDVPIKSIAGLLNQSVTMRELLVEQLIETNHRMNILYQNKRILNELIVRNIDERDFTLEMMNELGLKSDRNQLNPGYLVKELEQSFPGTLGKLCAILYHDELNGTLDTEEKANAWNDLISKLDEMNDIDFPDEIKAIIDDIHGDIERGRFSHRMKTIAMAAGSEDELYVELGGAVPVIEEMITEYYGNPENQRRIEGFYHLQPFILNNIHKFKETDRYIEILSGRKRKRYK